MSPKHKLVMLGELAQLGVRVSNPGALDEASATFSLEYPELRDTLREIRGGNVDYVPLFLDFPDDVPDDDAYFAKRLVGYLGSTFDDARGRGNAAVHPERLFDLRRFGADPVSQLQTESLWRRARDLLERREGDEHTEWLDVELVRSDEIDERLRGWLESCLRTKSSIKKALHGDIRKLLSYFGPESLDFESIPSRENQALVLRMLWEDGREQAACALATTPTDLLRLFAALTGSDVSLARPVKFPKLSRRQRRFVLGTLERSSKLEDDLRRYRGLWLELGRYIHPGEHRDRFPRVARAFDALRNGTIRTFDSKTEALLSGSDVSRVLEHLSKRPGVLARKLHELLRRFPKARGVIVDAFSTVARKMTVKSLLVLQSYFATINDADYRTVINKRGKVRVIPNNAKKAMSNRTLAQVQKALASALSSCLQQRESWRGKTVWIDPRLARYTVPLAQRAASDGLLTVGRGSRIRVRFDEVLRLFVYWKQSTTRTDLDLSVIQFDEDWEYAGHVSYMNLSDRGMTHSGDLQSAPHGAAELVDVTLDRVAPGVRYLAAQVYRYAGEAFADMVCHAGWMVRSKVEARYKTFDIKTVANKFDLDGRNGYCVPLVVDLKEREVIFTDIYMGAKAFHNNVEGTHLSVARVSREIARFTTTRPTMKTLAEIHAAARGAKLVDERDADISFGVRGCTYNATDVETVLSELL